MGIFSVGPVLDTRWYPFPLVTRWYPFLDHFSVVFVLDAIPSTFGYSVVSLPFGLLGGIPFLDHFYVEDHSAYAQDHGALGIGQVCFNDMSRTAAF